MKRIREDEAQLGIAHKGALLDRHQRGKIANDIEAYVKSLHLKLGDNRHLVFLEAMNDFRIHRINFAGLISRMRQLLKEDTGLMEGFMALLPDEYRERLVHTKDDSMYRTFLMILDKYCFENESKSNSDVYREMASMSFFRDHPDLLEEFKVLFKTKVDPLEKERKNYRIILFSCEDDMFELDMLLESFKQTVNCVEELLEKFNDVTIDLDDPIHLEDHFSSRNLSCIRYNYGMSGLEVISMMQMNAIHVLQVILMRLKQK
ncbi:hypothetical protein NE237_013196 [Protea cynaroides]|uniref:Histone deacetylase interacting domain-containing protein n=1 Tax=Protea cynaroides TaxID=273540 RepID=A0A9Q0GYV7_9MAGN|nr:hypothetical protein NE237_013196 [Protea cynaroides]